MSDPRDELSAFERSLSGLTPSKAVDRDHLMYEAGRRAGLRERRPWAWPAIAATLAAVALGQAVAMRRPPPERIVAIPVATPVPEPIVILTRRDPEAPLPLPPALPNRRETLTAGSDLATITETGPELLSSLYLGPLDFPPAGPLTPLNGRHGDLQSIPGGPL